MAVSLTTLDRPAVTVEPSDDLAVMVDVDTPLFPLDIDEVGEHARELQALVGAARHLVTVDPAWALWAFECAVDAEFLHDQDDYATLNTALRCLEVGVDQLYLAERRPMRALSIQQPWASLWPFRVGASELDRIDRQRLDTALDRIGHQGSPVFRARIADAYDAVVDGQVS